MRNEFLEKICETDQSWRAATKAEQLVAAAFCRAKDKGYDFLAYDDPLHYLTDNLPEFTTVMQHAGLTEFYYVGDWSNWRWDALELDEAGWKLLGIMRIENQEYKNDLERWGESDRSQTIPALRFRLEGVG